MSVGVHLLLGYTGGEDEGSIVECVCCWGKHMQWWGRQATEAAVDISSASVQCQDAAGSCSQSP